MREVVLIFVLPYILCLPAQDDVSKLNDEIFGRVKREQINGKRTNSLDLDPVGDKSAACKTEKGDPGQCVRYFLCDPNSLTIIDDGSKLLDMRKIEHSCQDYLDTCCKPTSVLEDSSATTQKQNSHNNINVDEIYRESPIDEQYFIQGNDLKRTTCGWNNPKIKSFKAVNKEVAENSIYSNYGDFPFMVALIKRSDFSDVWTPGDYLGGGSLIHPSYVLTVAHKFAKYEATALKCRAGEYDTQTVKEQFKHQERNVKKVVIHEKYYRTSLYNDVALLTLESPFDPAPHIGVACLGKTLPPEGTSCFAMGWGKNFNKDNEYAVILKKVKLGLVGASNCQNMLQKTRLGPFFRLHDSLTCAGGEEGVDTCRGDGGSPLVCAVDTDGDYTRYAVFGLMAYGINCGSENVPGVYVNVPHLYDWIEQQMDKEHEQKLFIY